MAKGLWPARPDDFSTFAQVILDFLNAAPVNLVRLRPMLWDWEVISDRAGEVREADLDGDGEVELVIVMADLTSLTVTAPGELLVLDKREETWQLIYRSTAPGEPPQRGLAILATQDINADGQVELAYTDTSCGAHTC
ncbi:MAG: hypothetical protein H5T84_06615, partial [Thermoleophilia bacterium]|nr:hypothetical protein [Thermoleophilia bacterium]